MKKLIYIAILAFVGVNVSETEATQDALVWPPSPDTARIAHVGEISCADLKPSKGLLGKISRLIGGHSASDEISLPFSPLVVGEELFLVCQNIKTLIQINRRTQSFRMIEDEGKTLRYPIGLCRGVENEIYLSDSEAGTIYRYYDGRLEPMITDGLTRPTGIAVDRRTKRLYVVDTGVHRIHVYGLDGVKLMMFPEQGKAEVQLNFPIDVAVASSGNVFVNDALNFQVKQFSPAGTLMNAFGFEGDAPGAFARPKGIALDSDEHMYVVDNLFDNFQVFDSRGVTLLAVGSAGQAAGEFWSPAGIDIVSDTIFIADTYNNRIQMFHYLGDGQ